MKNHKCSLPIVRATKRKHSSGSKARKRAHTDAINCPLCDIRPFDDKNSLTKHLRTDHKGVLLNSDTLSRLRITSCPQCMQIFSSLKSHVPGKAKSCIPFNDTMKSTLASLDPTAFFPSPSKSSQVIQTSSTSAIPISIL